eukprot:4349620-Prymnesium_polylepis.1
MLLRPSLLLLPLRLLLTDACTDAPNYFTSSISWLPADCAGAIDVLAKRNTTRSSVCTAKVSDLAIALPGWTPGAELQATVLSEACCA